AAAPAPTPTPASPPPAAITPVPSPPAATTPPPAAPPPVAAAPPPAPAAAARTAPPEEAPPEPLPPARGASGRPAMTPTGGPKSYAQLVAEADRALENGNTAKAQKFVEEALKLQPSGVAAVTTSGYVLLDKRKPLAAVGEFKRALNNAPNFPQALFGLGEAYRSAGNTPQAIDAYKKYLAAAPAGEDAPAARRQLRELESQPTRPSHSATATVPEPGAAPPPMPEQGPPP
ncbi:MAG TPA: tetratricopeptide repeat protein, partial [Polyangia bacterium]|nr:tetratricopeptide repeat protein [Polyangia bacterium]